MNKIHFWKTATLANELSQNRISETQGFYYFLANAVLLSMLVSFNLYLGVEGNWLFGFEALALVIVTVAGLYHCFNANGGPVGKQFVLRATCLSFPLYLKISILALMTGSIIGLTAGLFIDAENTEHELAYQLVGTLFLIGFTSGFYWRLGHHLRSIRDQNDTKTQDGP